MDEEHYRTNIAQIIEAGIAAALNARRSADGAAQGAVHD
jgi:hypothetical protein